ncbi:ABC transporter ATP-binding protein [bacterium]|nr:ABC transporter ATP-binding protein [bacterium]MCB1221184.1 ABC transporter ATP-binding protein [bacterium]UNM08045.1 MAG: ABC transporter ATP-binding protein [Planctomycetales bacterium]
MTDQSGNHHVDEGRKILSVEDLHVAYGAVKALRGISFSVKAGEIVTLIGANGAGKSTTMNCIMGLVKCQAGKIVFLDEDIANMHAFQIVRKGLSLSPEGRRLFLNLSVRENLEIGGLITLDKGKKQELLDEIFQLFPRVKERLTQIAGTLSGGEQQMVAISRAIMQNPDLLLLDEPSLGLAPNLVQEIFEKVQILNSEGKTILMVEQNAFQALRISHRAYCLEHGELNIKGTGAELLANPKIKEAYLGG